MVKPQMKLCRAETVRAGGAAGDITCGFVDMIHSNYVTVAFIFERRVDETRLLEGLRRALALLPAFAGRLRIRPGGTDIVCSDAGIPVEIFDVEATRDEALAEMLNPGTRYVSTVDEEAPLDERPLLMVRVCRLADGALTVGCTWCHTVGDMHSFMLFAQAWSAFVEGRTPPQVLVVGDREAYLDRFLPARDSGRPGYRLLSSEELELRGRLGGRPDEENRVVQILFTSEEVDRMRRTLSRKAGRRLSSNDGLIAHVAATVRQLHGYGDMNVSSLVNLRGRLGMPAGLVGNPLWPVAVFSPSTQDPAELALRIREGLDDFPTRHLSIRSTRAHIDGTGRSWPADFDRVLGVPGNPVFRVTSWKNSGAYGISFEGQAPVFFNPVFPDLGSLPRLPGPITSITEAPGSGLLFVLVAPAALAELLRNPVGRAMIHEFTKPGDARPAALAVTDLV